MGAAPADDGSVVSDGLDRLGRVPDEAGAPAAAGDGLDPAAIMNVVGDFRALEFPWIAKGQPLLGVFLLPAVDHDLPEEAVVVTNAIAVGRDAEAGHAFEKARSKPAEAAIAERRIGLGEAHAVEFDAEIAERPVHNI